MGKINLARVDDRLIHGQVMVKWSKGMGTNALYVVDDDTASDDFMKDVYVATNSQAGLKIKVYSVKEVVTEWKKNNFGDDTTILLFKNIESVKSSFDAGLEIKELNIGGIAKRADAKFVITTVGLNKANAEILQELENKGVHVYFQIVPDSEKVELKDALKKL